jgi:hypothetical protein
MCQGALGLRAPKPFGAHFNRAEGVMFSARRHGGGPFIIIKKFIIPWF